MIQFKQDMVLVRTTTTSLANLGHNRPADHITTGQIPGIRCIALHEALTFIVDQVTTFTACAFTHQHAFAGNTGGMELEKFHVLQRYTRTQCHGHAVTGIDQGIGVGAENLAGPTGGQQACLGLDDQFFTRRNIQYQGTQNRAFLVV